MADGQCAAGLSDAAFPDLSLSACGDGDDLELVAVAEFLIEFRGGEGPAVELDDDGFSSQPEGVEEGGKGERSVELLGFAVDGEGHHFVRMAASQSFQTGSNPFARRRWAISVAGRLSSISNWPVAREQEEV